MVRKNKVFVYFIIIFTVYFLIFSVSILSALPKNPLTPKKSTTLYISQVFPQGWGFFSKSPKDEYLNVYQKDGNKSVQWPNMRVSNLFGINRKGRAQGTEVGLILNDIPEVNFFTCEKDIKECIKDVDGEKAILLENKTPHSTLCGEQYIAIHKPLPWAWSNSSNRKYTTSHFAKVELKCSKK